MKNKFQKMLFLIASLGVMNSAYAYKLVIFTDEAATNKSDQVVELMKKTYPFNVLDIEFEIVKVSAEDLKCESTRGVERFISCSNSLDIQKKAKVAGGDQAMVIKNLSKYGGSSGVGGGIPVMTTSSAPETMLHEYLHTLGMNDEYEYPAEEANDFCTKPDSTPNVAFIEPRNPYANDGAARAMHSGEIPWYGNIYSTTPITGFTGSILGTGKVNFNKQSAYNSEKMGMSLDQPTGLYRAKVCNKAIPPKASWQPGGSATIMENTKAGLGAPMERIVKNILIKKGVREKLQIVETPVVEPEKQESHAAASVEVTPEPSVEVDNTSRPFFKSFFTWIKNLIQNNSNTSSR